MTFPHLLLAAVLMFLQPNLVMTDSMASPPCLNPLGMENGDIPNRAFMCKGTYFHYGPCYVNARLNSKVAWRASYLNTAFLQIDLGFQKYVSAVGSQVSGSGYVKAFSLAFTKNGLEWFNYQENGQTKIFLTSTLSPKGHNYTKHDLSGSILSKMVRLYVEESVDASRLRVEFYGCEYCRDTLDVASGLPDSAITASSYLDSGFLPSFGRLHQSFGNGSWCSKKRDPRQYLQFYIGPDKAVTEIAIQGIPKIKVIDKGDFPCSEQISPSPTTNSNAWEPDPVYHLDVPYEVMKIHSKVNKTHCNASVFVSKPAWVSEFSVLYSDDALEWSGIIDKGILKTFSGQKNSEAVINVRLPGLPIKARYIRILPLSWKNWICMRVELYGCDMKPSVGISSGLIQNSAITANSSKLGKEPWRGRLNNPSGCWCAAALTDVELVIDLVFVYCLQSFATQGNPNHTTSEWVTHVSVMYKEKFTDDWRFHESNGVTTVFTANNDRNGIVQNTFEPKIDASVIKFLGFHYVNSICMRVELYGYRGEMAPLGIENSAIPSGWFMSVFSFPYYSRLNKGLSLGPTKSPVFRFIMVNLGSLRLITGMATKGGVDLYVYKLSVHYSMDKVFWTDYQEKGTTKMFSCNDDGTIKLHAFRKPFNSKFLKIQFHSEVGRSVPFSFELYGKNATTNALGMENGEITNEQMMDLDKKRTIFDTLVTDARLNHDSAWCTMNGTAGPYGTLLIDLLVPTLLTAVGSQGYPNESFWISKYEVVTTTDFVTWKNMGQFGFKPLESNSIVKGYFADPVVARWVEIKTLKFDDFPCIRFELYGSRGDAYENLALFKPTEQSSTGSHDSSKAVDGILTSTITAGSCSSTEEEDSPWWRVDLEHEFLIRSVSIKNNEDSCCFQRLSNLKVTISVNLTIKSVCATDISITAAGEHRKIVCTQMRKGRYVEIVSLLRTVLTLCEVQVEAYVSAEMKSDPVGFESGTVKNESITASSSLGKGYLPHHGRLNTIIGSGGWCALHNYPNTEYLQVDLEVRHTVKAVYTQGLASGFSPPSATVLTFFLSYGDNGLNWVFVMQDGAMKVLPKGSYFLGTAILGRYFRFHPLTWQTHICMRVEIIGERLCSSQVVSDLPTYAMKESAGKGWNAKLSNSGWQTTFNKDQYLVVNVVPGPKRLNRIVTISGGYGVRWYSMSYSYNGIDWVDYMEHGKVKVFSGSVVTHLAVSHDLKRQVIAQLVKISVLGANHHAIDLNLELYGCKFCDDQPLGMEDGSIQNSSITASRWKRDREPYKGRLNGATGWCSGVRTTGEYVQVDLTRVLTISAITMQVVNTGRISWPYSFSLAYSYDGRIFRNYSTQDGQLKIFNFGGKTRPQTKYYLDRFVEARKIRVYVLGYFYNEMCMRFELHGSKKDCFGPVELSFKDAKRLMKASSYLGLGFEPWYGDMRTGDESLTWCAADISTSQFLQLDLIFSYRITEITVSGRTADPNTFEQLKDSWVSRYRLKYSGNKSNWKDYQYSGTIVEIRGNSGIKTAVSHAINISLIARYVRIVPVQWENWICMRAELRGCKVQNMALGMGNGDLPLIQHDKSGGSPNGARLGRLYIDSWQSVSLPQRRSYLQIGGLGSKYITSIATAVNTVERTYSYSLSYTEEDHILTDYTENGVLKIFEGNRNIFLVVKHNLKRPLSVRTIRLNPITWKSIPAFKVELYGNEVCNKTLGLESGLLPNSSITSNSFKPGFEPWNARLNSPSPWCYDQNNDRGMLYIDLVNLTDVIGLASQDPNDHLSLGYTKHIRIFYSLDNIRWKYYGKHSNLPKDISIVGPPLIDGVRRLHLRTFTARYLAIQSSKYSELPCLRMEVYGCKARTPCPKLLGMTSGKIANESLSASSYLSPDFLPWFARLDTKIAGGGWCAARNNISEFIQVDLKGQYNLTRLILQGRGVDHMRDSAWVSVFSLEYSMDGVKWKKHAENGTQEFNGNTDSGTKEVVFTRPIMARFARILTLDWHNWTCLRFEFEGCNVRSVPFGFETGEYRQDALISSNTYEEKHARLNQDAACSLDNSQQHSSAYSYLQIRIEPYGRVATAIAIQGYPHKWVSTYQISFSNDGKHFTYYMERGQPKIFEGNKDAHEVIRELFFPEIRARFIRFLPRTIVDGYALRMELYGYEACSYPLGIRDGRIPNGSITASSSRPGYEAWRVRPGTSSSWSPIETKGWLQVDVGRIVSLTAIGISFDRNEAKGVAKFNLASKKYLADDWLTYSPRGNDFKIFDCSFCLVLTKLPIDGDSIVARYFKVIILSHVIHPHLKMELYGCEQVCMEDLGMKASFIKDASITASSILNQQSLPPLARLNTNHGYGGWCTNHTDTSPYLQIDLRWLHEVRAISTQGQRFLYDNSWVKQYTVSYLKEVTNETWENYMESGVIKVFVANNDSLSIVQNTFSFPITARLLRIHPISWSSKACLRLELHGCEVSRDANLVALGMKSMEIPDQNIIASSYLNSFEPWKARIPLHGWMASLLPNQFIQIDLGITGPEIVAIGTMHAENKFRRVLEFFLSFSDEGSFWYECMEYSTPKRFHNEIHHDDDSSTQPEQKHFLPRPIRTRYLKLVVVRWQLQREFTLSLELYGKKGSASSLLKPVAYTASSYIYSNPPRLADIMGNSAWCAEFIDQRQFLQLDIGEIIHINGVETANVSASETVNTFIVSTSLYGSFWEDYKEKQVVRVFSAHQRQLFVKTILARFVRFKPKNWTQALCLRAGVIGKDPTLSLGIEKWKVSSFQMTASSHAGPGTEPWRARLNSDDLSHAWCAGEDRLDQYLQIDLLYEHNVTHVALQGRFATGSEAWVIDYWLLYSMDDIVWNYHMQGSRAKILKGNADPFRVVKERVDPSIRCRFIRIKPNTWHGRMCLKTELYGYPIIEPIGINSGDIPNAYISASTFKPDHEPWKARLNRHDNLTFVGWEPFLNDSSPYLEIKGVNQMRLMGISTQGRHSITSPAFVTNYTLKTSTDGSNWIDYVEDGIQKVFDGNNDTFGVVTHILKSEIVVKAVRIVPFNWTNGVALRVELIGVLVFPNDGYYTAYSNWSVCSATCGPGFQFRTRNCSNPEPMYGGRNCTRLGSEMQMRKCNGPLCPAPNYTAPRLFKKDETTTLTIQNCTGLNLTIDFGDGTNVNTSACSIDHTYTISGIVEILVTAPYHQVTRSAHYVEHTIRSFQQHNATKAVLLGKNFTCDWSVEGGLILQLGFSYGDGSSQKSTVITRGASQTGLEFHRYDSVGIFPIEMTVSNLLNMMSISLTVIVETAVNVTLSLSTKSIFDRTYELDEVVFQIEVHNGSNPHFSIDVDDGTPVLNQTSTTLVHRYRTAAFRMPHVLAYNNVSSYPTGYNITIYKIDLIANATLDVHDTIYPNSTLVNLTVSYGNPFLCLIDLGDGTLTNRTSLDNSTRFNHTYAVAETYTIAVNCSNHLSYQLLSKTIKVQHAIQKVSLAPTTPVVANDTLTFVIAADHKGTNSCYVVRPGDGSMYGIGKPHCSIEHPSVAFIDIQLPFLINHIYKHVGFYMVTVSGSNAVSSAYVEGSAAVVSARCSFPNISLININTIKEDPTIITRVQDWMLYTTIYIDCDPTTLYDVHWNISLTSVQDSKGFYYKTLESLGIYKRTLDYGLYQVLFNVSMRGIAGVYQFQRGFIQVTANDLIPIILGGHFVRRGLNKLIFFDASETYDPDFAINSDGFQFYWSCSNGSLPSIESIRSMSPLNRSGLPVYNESRFCRSDRTIHKGGSTIYYTTALMSIGDNYSIAVDVFKVVQGMVRHARFVQVMRIVNAPSLYLRCLINCLTMVNPNDKLSLEVFSPDLTDTANYHWRLFHEVTSNNVSTWMEIKGLRNLTTTELNNRFVVMTSNSIVTKGRFKLQATGWILDGPRGLVEYIFSVNRPPYGGSCDVEVSSDALYKFNCSEWIDDHLPLTYSLHHRTRFGVDLMLYHSAFPSFEIPLPLGNPNDNYTLTMTMRILDFLGVYNTTVLQTMVVRNESANTTALLLGNLDFLDNSRSGLQGLVDKGILPDACSRVIAMMSVLNSMDGELEHMSLRMQIRNKAAKILSQWNPRSIFQVQILATALSETIVVADEVSVATQRYCLDSFSVMSDFAIGQSRDRSISLTSVMDTVRILSYGLSKILSASSDSAKVPYIPSMKDINISLPNSINLTLNGTSPPNEVRLEAENISKEVLVKVDDLAKESLSRLAPGEDPFEIDLPILSMSLQRIKTDNMNKINFATDNASVQFPNSNTLFGATHSMEDASVKMMKFKRNIFTWSITWLQVKSEVLLVELKDPVQQSLSVSQIAQPIHLIMPRDVTSFPPPEMAFINKQNQSFTFHKFNLTSLKPTNFRIMPVDGQVSFGIYWKYAMRPEKQSEYFVGRLPDFSSCKSKDSSYTDCEKDPHTIIIDTSRLEHLGEYFLGIQTLEDFKANEKERVRRSACEGSGRSKRSCLEYKTPPPTPAPHNGGPVQYNPSLHANYTIQRFYSPCLFWDDQNNTWRGEGCTTGNLTSYRHIHCKCTHLTSFGGDLLVAPNPIDFDKVFAGFANISDNMAVLGTIIAAFSIYTILAVYLRKLDKRDAARGGTTVIKSTIDSTEDHPYEVIVQTGSWNDSGTSANVFLTIVGEEGESTAIHLTDNNKSLFDRGATDEFIVLLPTDIGKIHLVRVWHDMTGPSSSWYLNYIIIRNIKTGAQFNFVSDRWFALEKEDGAIERLLKVSAKEEMTSFKTLFRQKTEKDICDGHLWISVVAKPPKSTFTRVQRLSCCMSLLFTSMITNAMFYNLGNEPDTSSVTLGPITISIKQVIIGIQSSFIALPINIVILQIFQKARAKESERDNKFRQRRSAYQNEGEGGESCDDRGDESSKTKKKGLPHWTVYLAWTLCVLATLASAAFTLFYSMMWGKETSNKWISSMLVSFFQDAFVTQPLKIFLLALFIATLFKKVPQEFAKKDTKEQKLDSLEVEVSGNEIFNEDMVSVASRCQPPNEELIRRARDYKMKELRMHGIIKENIFFAIFLLALLGVSYSIRDYESFQQTNNIKGMFTYQVRDNVTWWKFVENTVLKFSFSRKWYNTKPDDAEGFTIEKNYYMVGMPRLRQVRVKRENCTLGVTKSVKPECVSEYSLLNEDTSYYLPGWREPGNLTSEACPIPWRYQTSWELDGIPFWGHKAVYDGGGFTADFGYEMWQAVDVVSKLKKYNWVDVFSKAVLVEFTIFDPQVNLFSMVTYAFEITGTGSGSSFVKVDTFKLYLHLGPSKMLLIFCEALSIIICLILTFYTCKRVKNEGLKYFKNKWNLIESAQLGLCYAAVGLFIVRLTFAAKTIKKLQENPFLFVSFQYIAKWHEVNVYVIGIIVFIATMKFLRLMKFNRHIAILSRTISNCLKDVAIIGFQALLVFTAFSIVAYVIFGTKMEDFSSYILTLQSQLTMMLGKGYFTDMSQADPILGPLYFSFFVFAMMFFLLNMFIAVIADSYADESTGVDPDSEEFIMAGFIMDRIRSLLSTKKPTAEPWMEIKSPEYKDWPGTIQEALFEKASRNHEMLRKKEIQLDNIMQGLLHAEKTIAKSEHSIAGKTIAAFPSHDEFSKTHHKVALILLTEGYNDEEPEAEC